MSLTISICCPNCKNLNPWFNPECNLILDNCDNMCNNPMYSYMSQVVVKDAHTKDCMGLYKTVVLKHGKRLELFGWAKDMNGDRLPALCDMIHLAKKVNINECQCCDNVKNVKNISVVKTPVDMAQAVVNKFMKFVTDNPRGVVSLPTGKTPEYFIGLVKKQRLPPNLRFVQIDEFYPIAYNHPRSFYSYIQKYYINDLGIQPSLMMKWSEQGILKDLGVDVVFPDGVVPPPEERTIEQKLAVCELNMGCIRYEKQIKAMGGIGFFLGGVGPDGHIAFNLNGCKLNTKTHYTYLNYETAAQAAVDMGGIENARGKLAVTIGLKTIARSEVVIMAAGEGKARVIADSLVSRTMPMAGLRHNNNASLVITEGAAKYLDFHVAEEWVEACLESGKPLNDLGREDIPVGLWSLPKLELPELSNLPVGKRILHTAPHHDDIMLAYHPLVGRMKDSNEHHFCYLTSGYHSVTDEHLAMKMGVVIDKKASKMLLREMEAENVWQMGGFDPAECVSHMRSKFYNDDYFNPMPLDEDIQAFVDLLNEYKPDIVTVALDPQGTGPDTHFKVMQLVASALNMVDFDVVVWGYRNVWYRFDFEVANRAYVVSEAELQRTHEVFMESFESQAEASFPSPYFDGPFSEWANTIQRTQLKEYNACTVGSGEPEGGMILMKEFSNKMDFLFHAAELESLVV